MPTQHDLNNASHSLYDNQVAQELEIHNGVTYQDVEHAVVSIQTRQEARRELMDMTRLAPFMDKMNQLENITEVVLANSSTPLAPIWADLRFILETSSTLPAAFDGILEAYQSIGEVLPAFSSLEYLLQTCPETFAALRVVYGYVLDLHHFIVPLLKRTAWRQTFGPSWKDFKERLKSIISNLRAYKDLLDAQASLFNTVQNQHNSVNYHFTLIAGNNYDHINVNGGSAHFGDQYNGNNYAISDGGQIAEYHAQLCEKLSQLQISVNDATTRLDRTEQTRLDDRKDRILTWLAGSSTSEHHELACRQRADFPHTGLWILNNSVVSSWLYDDLPKRSSLWIHGIPGAGKTVLASIIIEACMSVADAHTSYFYCKNDDPENGSPISILKGLIIHSIQPEGHLMPYLDEQRRQDRDAVLRSETTAKRLLEMLCREGHRRRYLILDGLDECQPKHWKSILSHLTSIIRDMDQLQASKVRLLIISQSEPEIRRLLSEASEFRLSEMDNRDDIVTYLSHWTAKVQRKFKLSSEQEEAIHKQVLHRAAGQFLYARLVVENLYDQISTEKLVAELQEGTFPQELSQAYERIIVRIKSNLKAGEWEAARGLLGWMTCSARPLKWHEMQGANSIDFKAGEVFFEDRKLRRSVEEFCGALVMKVGDRVFLVHSTARQFIAKSKHIDAATVECDMATLCLHYLAFQCFDADHTDHALRQYLMKGYFAFSDYAIAKWMHHFYRVLDFASELMSGDDSPARIGAIKEFSHATHFFAGEYEEDLQMIEDSLSSQQSIEQLSPEATELFLRVPDTEQDHYLVWMHIRQHRRNTQSRNEISVEKLRKAMEKIRENLEFLASDKGLTGKDKADFQSFYGNRVYKCPKITCFYFHEGFKDSKTRQKHVSLHDRPFQCSQEDCASFEFGFSSKQELERHTEKYHPDVEIKASLFKETKIKPEVNARHRCGMCDKAFTRRAALKDHELVHAGQKPCKCSSCGKAFTRKNDCTRHEKIHERQPNISMGLSR